MRRILVENARRKKRQKRGGDALREILPLDQLSVEMDDDELVALDEALEELAKLDPLKAQLVTLRFFGGQTIEQAAEIMGISRTSASRYWTYARAWLHRRLTESQ